MKLPTLAVSLAAVAFTTVAAAAVPDERPRDYADHVEQPEVIPKREATCSWGAWPGPPGLSWTNTIAIGPSRGASSGLFVYDVSGRGSGTLFVTNGEGKMVLQVRQGEAMVKTLDLAAGSQCSINLNLDTVDTFRVYYIK